MKRQIIQPEYLRAGALLQARDLAKLRANFYFRHLPAEHGNLFLVGGDGYPTRFTPTTQTGIVWVIATASAVSTTMSLNVIRQFFQIPTEVPAEAYQVLSIPYRNPDRHYANLYVPAALMGDDLNDRIAQLLAVPVAVLEEMRCVVPGQSRTPYLSKR